MKAMYWYLPVENLPLGISYQHIFLYRQPALKYLLFGTMDWLDFHYIKQIGSFHLTWLNEFTFIGSSAGT